MTTAERGCPCPECEVHRITQGRPPRVAVTEQFRRFVLQRDTDVTGVSGTGVVAEGVSFSNGVAVLQWTSKYPTSVVFHQKGMDSVRAIHGHDGATRIVWLDDPQEPAS